MLPTELITRILLTRRPAQTPVGMLGAGVIVVVAYRAVGGWSTGKRGGVMPNWPKLEKLSYGASRETMELAHPDVFSSPANPPCQTPR